MRAIFINPATRTCTELNYSGEIKQACALIRCRNTTTIEMDETHSILVDFDKLLRAAKHYFQIPSYPLPLPGKALLVGAGRQSATLSVEAARNAISFPAVRFIGVTETIEEHDGYTLVHCRPQFERLN